MFFDTNDVNKWLLLDVYPKTRFLDLQKIPKVPKLKKMVSIINFLSDLVLKLLINLGWI